MSNIPTSLGISQKLINLEIQYFVTVPVTHIPKKTLTESINIQSVDRNFAGGFSHLR